MVKKFLVMANKLVYNFTAWIETQQQTNGNAIMIGGQKPMFDNSIDKNRIALCTRC